MFGFAWRERRISSLLAVLAGSCIQPAVCRANTSAGTEISIHRVYALNPVPKWENGFFIGFEFQPQHAPPVFAYDRDGRKLFEAPLAIDGTSRVLVRSSAASRDGRFAFSGSAESSSGARTSFIAFLDRAGRITRVIRLNRLAARHLCFAPDGTLWAAVQAVGWAAEGVEPEHDVLRAYSPEGELKFSLLPRSSFAPVAEDWVRNPHPVDETEFAPSQIVANQHETVFMSPGFRELIRVSAEGKVLSRTRVSRPAPEAYITGFALAPDGGIYLTTQEKTRGDASSLNFVFYRWNAIAEQWIRIYSRSSRERGRPFAVEMFDQDRMLVQTEEGRFRWVLLAGGDYRLSDQ